MTSSEPPSAVDLDHPSAARAYDYFLGGSSNFAVAKPLGYGGVGRVR